MKIFVTGITGFIGRRLLDQFSPCDEIYVLSRKVPGNLSGHVHVIQGDLVSSDELFSQLVTIRPDVCIHLAWEGIPDYGFEQSLRNLEHSSRLLRHLVEECGCKKIIATGSCWEYGKSFGSCREDDPCQGGNYFVWAKRALCDFGLILASRYQISFIWTRLFYVYGPGQRSGALIPTITEALLKGEPPTIQTPSNSNDFVYVDDVADALLQIARQDTITGIYNFGTGETVPVWKVCEIIERVLGHEPTCSIYLKSIDSPVTSDFFADTTKTESFLNWCASTSLEEGIGQYLNAMGVRD